MNVFARKNECEILERTLYSKQSEFLVVYGRRRVGKTFLIKEYFNEIFSFYTSGVLQGNTRTQLKAFNQSLIEYGGKNKNIPKDWFDAFSRLKELLKSDGVYHNSINNKKIVFIDEVPWMDTARSDFKAALDFFWNTYASTDKDLVFILCGSATSWIIKNLITSKGGFYNRITRKIHLMPFTLKESEEYFNFKQQRFTRKEIVEIYMVFGGIPYYLNLLNDKLSIAQNINLLCFNSSGALYYEYELLFNSLFKNYKHHIAIIEELSNRKAGMTREDLAKIKEVGEGTPLTTSLIELEECGFIRKYTCFNKNKYSVFYQIIDPFILFSLQYLKNHTITSWINHLNTPSFYSWSGYAFETLCLNHIDSIKYSLGITGIETKEYSWRSKSIDNKSQIDLIIERSDNVINLCEMKYTLDEYAIEKDYSLVIAKKINTFNLETNNKKRIITTFITINGVKNNSYRDTAQKVLDINDLFLI